MPEIEDEVTFTTRPDQARFTTQTNGDVLVLKFGGLTREQAATLAWLVNSPNTIQFQVKVKP